VSKRRVLKLASEISAEVEWTNPSAVARGADFEVTVAAPPGYHWGAVGVHQLVYSSERPGESRSLWAAALGDMRGGIESCGTEFCEEDGH